MKNITCKELKEKIKNEENLFLVDVREPFEHADEILPGVNIPTSEIKNEFEKIPKDGYVVLYCRSGARSAMVIDFLERNFGYSNLINLDGGVMHCDN